MLSPLVPALVCVVVLCPLQAVSYGADPKWVSNDVVQEYDGRIHLNLPGSCTLMLVQQQD